MFHPKQVLSYALILVLLAGLLTGCAAASKSQGSAQDNLIMETTMAATAGAPSAERADASFSKSTGQTTGQGGGDVQNTVRKIVRNANLGLEVVDVKAAYEQLLAYAKARNGYETMRNESKYEDFLYLNATIRLDPAELDNFIAFAGTVGTLVNTQISTDDITESYYDATTRLETMEKSLAKYDGFLLRAQTVEEVLAVQNQINQITVEIESLKGRIRLWDSMLSESTISIEIRQVNDPVKIKKDITWSALSWADMVYLIRSGLTRFANGFVTVVQWLFIALVAASPVWIILLIVFLVWRRRRNAKKTKAPKAEPPKPEPPKPEPPKPEPPKAGPQKLD